MLNKVTHIDKPALLPPPSTTTCCRHRPHSPAEMAVSNSKYKYYKLESSFFVDLDSFCIAFVLIALILIMCSNKDDTLAINKTALSGRQRLVERPCDEIYVVGEGETLNTISDKCGDPYIVERNPHVHDPDDVFPGLVIKIVPLALRN
ncbi:hypothetical protein CASFOL_002034 [Castilleja foliolosa]|uniref:LysM domain-containing protein n=1 Tax=Castilleja foliolosa TaxID=1961234 RepID=A0ABD3EDG0_9LAMI